MLNKAERSRLYLATLSITLITLLMPLYPPNESKAEVEQMLLTKNITETYQENTKVNDYIICAKGANKFAEDELMQTLKEIPSYILAEFFRQGWVIELKPDLLFHEDVGDCFAMYMPGDKKIEIYEEYPASIHHEMGHFFDGRVHPGSQSKLSNSEEWISAYEEEKEALAKIDDTTSVNAYNQGEAFAEVFRLILENKDAEEKIPKMWRLMNAYIEYGRSK